MRQPKDRFTISRGHLEDFQHDHFPCDFLDTAIFVFLWSTAGVQCLRPNRTCLDICKIVYDPSTALSTCEIVRPNDRTIDEKQALAGVEYQSME